MVLATLFTHVRCQPRPLHMRRTALRTAATLALAASLPALAAAQGFSFEPIGYGVPGVDSLPTRIADVNGDGRPDLAYMSLDQRAIRLHLNLGDGRFGPASDIANVSAPLTLPPSFELKDLDGDGDVDLVYLSGDYTGSSLPVTVSTKRNDGSGNFTASFSMVSPANQPVQVLASDFDGDLDVDLILPNYFASATISLLRNDGTGQFTSTPTTATGGSMGFFGKEADLDADGDTDLLSTIGDGINFAHVNNGTGTFAVTPASSQLGYLLDATLVDLDNDGDLDAVHAMGAGGGYFLVARRNEGALVFSSPILIQGATMPSFSRFVVGDFDGDALADVVVDSGFPPADARFFRNLGGVAFTQVSGTAGIVGASVRGSADFDADGDRDILTYDMWTTGTFSILRNQRVAGAAFCFGDGSALACPCGNSSPATAKAGCLNSTGLAGTLRAAGGARLTSDTLVLQGTNMPSISTVLYFQGTSTVAAGAGAIFGDGLRCAGGTSTRLGVKLNAGGASTLPSSGGPSLSVVGAATAGGTMVYQGWYRDTFTFCTGAGFNLTNGLLVLWVP